MLLLHQVGSLKIGEVVRYTLTYTPSQDRILPSPEKLFVRLRNTSAIALRAAFVHGPYTLSVAAYPSGFDPNKKFEKPHSYGVPEFEPMVKAGGSWECELLVPEDIRQGAGTGGARRTFGKGQEYDGESSSWVIEVSSQVIFSTSAAVGYELVVARDHKSLNLSTSLPVVGNQTQAPQPGRISDHQQSIGAKDGHHPAQPKGIFSRAVRLKVEDTATLWNTPRLPAWDDAGDERVEEGSKGADEPVESVVDTDDPNVHNPKPGKTKKLKKVHLVVLTHGLHSNLGADMLFMKESIDVAVKQAKIDRKARLTKDKTARREASSIPVPKSPGQKAAESFEATEEAKLPSDSMGGADARAAQEEEEEEEDDDDEEVIVRGYSGNATKTERGIKYLGKRLARYVLSMTYPDQPYLPVGKGSGEGFAHDYDGQTHESSNPAPSHTSSSHTSSSHASSSHKHSTIHTDHHRRNRDLHKRSYKITSISFIAHSLGGLVQTYAVAYVQKHSPQFFELIKPINFVCLATPFLGLSNENPLYVKFALDTGLVGRTGKDLGLAWRAPTLARSGWGAIVGNLGETAHKKVYGETQPESKPLLRILPTGPAHTALKQFRSRTVYSNVVNDGIVPLRTSCLLFLDWQGLGRVEKARRDAGLVETMVGFGWAELTGTNMASTRQKQLLQAAEEASDSGTTTPRRNSMRQVPQPASDAIDDDNASLRSVPTPAYEENTASGVRHSETHQSGPLAGFFNFFKNHEPPKPQTVSLKQKKILRRGQTMPPDDESEASASDSTRAPKVTSGSEFGDDPDGMLAPPRTTFFESAGDLLNPKMPDVDYIIDPTKRPRTIFHDRVYHPRDIPLPPLKKRSTSLMRRRSKSRSQTSVQAPASSTTSSPHSQIQREDSFISTKGYDDTSIPNPDRQPGDVVDSATMRVEEKIARGYHRELAWRKVLVKLEPDAHNNIIVRRMFANAFGWPVVKHLVEAHFSDAAVSRMPTEKEFMGERAKDVNQPPDEHGEEIKAGSQSRNPGPDSGAPSSRNSIDGRHLRNASEAREATDDVPDLPTTIQDSASGATTDSLAPGGSSARRMRSKERPGVDRVDSVVWTERDFADSDESDHESVGSKEKGSPETRPLQGKGKDKTATASGSEQDHGQDTSGSWKWTEKIVGKGASSRGRQQSPDSKQSST